MAEAEKPTPNHKLRFERDRRAWSQQEVAERVGTTPLNVGRWERGVTVPSPYFRQKLCEVFEKSPYELGLVAEHPPALPLSEPPPTPGKPAAVAETSTLLWNVPYGRNIFFTGREEVLDHLRAALSAQAQPIAISQPQAISALGGIGKTQTAVEYAYRYRDDYTAVFWARAESVDLLVSDYLNIAALLDLPERNEQDQNVVVKATLRWFNTHEGWLLILDNADDLEMASVFIPSSGNGHVLLTTRAFSTGTVAGRIELDTMMMEEGMLFLLRRIKRIRGNASLESVPENIHSQARAIVEAMDALPLALDQAGAYIEETGTGLADYFKLYRTRRQRLLRKRGQSAAGHPEPVATTWSLSVEKIRQANPAAAELLCLLSLLHPDSIPESMIVAGAAALGPMLQPVASDEFDFNEALGELHKYSLIKRDPEEKLIAIHRLVQAVIWDGMGEQEREQWTERTVAALNSVFPQVTSEGKHKVWGQCERLLPHVLTYMTTVASHKYSLELASLLVKAAGYLCQRAQYEEAEPLFLRALHIREHSLNPEDPDIASSLYWLASLYFEQGRYQEAESLYQRALDIFEQTLGSEHPQVASSLGGLAILYRGQGRYEEAEPLFQRALHIREKSLGPEHSQVAYPLNGLALLYFEQSRYEEAEPLYQRALHIFEQALGSEHPDLAYPLNNLAILYREQGRYEEAEPLYQRALHIREKSLGPEHPDTAYPLAGLAVLYFKRTQYEEAEPLFQRALHIWEQNLGPEHDQVALLLVNLAVLYREQGWYEQAEPLFQRALRIFEQTLGPEHPYIAYPLNNLAILYREQGWYEQAEPLFQRALTIRQYHRGAQHPETAETLHDFARFYEMRNQLEEALTFYLQALAIREQQLGPQHPRTIETRTRVAHLFRASGRIEEAEVLEVAPLQQAMTSHQPVR